MLLKYSLLISPYDYALFKCSWMVPPKGYLHTTPLKQMVDSVILQQEMVRTQGRKTRPIK